MMNAKCRMGEAERLPLHFAFCILHFALLSGVHGGMRIAASLGYGAWVHAQTWTMP